LRITLDPATTPPGSSTGTLLIEPLLGSGVVTTITINATNASSNETPLSHHLTAPQVASDGTN
ncbi:MAG TPA: hypothetical protein VJQ83_08305, partial [Tepidiformaceae bacterium]|nr:hypothetical protein [Tepidiformaceae bacterium]